MQSLYLYSNTSLHLGNSLKTKFPYLIKRKLKEGEEVRRVAQFDWKIIEGHCGKPFISSGLEFVPLPVTCSNFGLQNFLTRLSCTIYFVNLYFYMQVMHGEDYICLGFLFGRKSRIAYISDVSRFPASTEYGMHYLFFFVFFSACSLLKMFYV